MSEGCALGRGSLRHGGIFGGTLKPCIMYLSYDLMPYHTFVVPSTAPLLSGARATFSAPPCDQNARWEHRDTFDGMRSSWPGGVRNISRDFDLPESLMYF